MNVKTMLIAAALSATLLTGCARTQPVHNVNQMLIQHYSDNQIKTAIIEAGIGRRWVMTPVAPGIMNGQITERGHSATIRVTYNTQNYQIHYVSSDNLLAQGGKIHRNYNRWINNLNQDIQLRLAQQNTP